MKNELNPYTYFSKFILRTPQMDFDFYLNLHSEETISNEILKSYFENKIVKEAILLASPSLYFEIEKWISGDLNPKKEIKIRFSLIKYLTRMSTRCTPFGLFAGCAIGTLSDNTDIVNSRPTKNRRHTRLDMNYLVALSQDLAKKNKIRNQLLYFPNNSIYNIGNKLRYIEYYYVESRRHHQIVEIETSIYLNAILKLAKKGAYLTDIICSLTSNDVDEDEAREYVEELLDSQVLTSELEPSVSGPGLLNQILEILKKIDCVDIEISFLKKIEKEIQDLDLIIGNDKDKYVDISNKIKETSTEFQLKYLFQTDLELSPEKNHLSKTIAESVLKGMVLLNKLTPVAPINNLETFKRAYLERYEDREMPLATVLDVETGIGYIQEIGSGDLNPLVDDLMLPQKKNINETTKVEFSKVHEVLLEKLISSSQQGAQVITIDETDFDMFSANWSDLPDTMSTIIEILNENGNEKVKISGISGSSAANLIGRFCHGDKAIYNFSKEITALEEKMNPNSILAEIVHLPESRVGNILMRPKLRKYEIPYLAKSVIDINDQIQLDDLMISIKFDKIYLRSKSLDKEIVPRLSNAHNYTVNSLPIYNFLCDLQTSKLREVLYFDFGPLEMGRSFLPRVEYGNLILKEAEWKVDKSEIKSLVHCKENVSQLKKEVSKFLKKLRLPQYVLLSEGDNELLIDFGNLTSVQMFLDIIKNGESFNLKEFLYSQKGTVKSSSGFFTNQLVLSFFNEQKMSSYPQNK